MEKMEIVEICFANIRNLGGHNILELDAEYKDYVEEIVRCHGEETEHYLNNSIKTNDFLIAIKYLGNGIFEEMTTHEKLISESNFVEFWKPNVKRFSPKTLENVDGEKTCIPINYEDYLIENQSQEKLLSKAEYVNLLQESMQLVIDYPLTLLSFGNGFSIINEETKETYLKYPDEERKKIINEAKKAALLDAKKVTTRITETINKMTTISNDDIDMAYLDNQLYDFTNEGRSR